MAENKKHNVIACADMLALAAMKPNCVQCWVVIPLPTLVIEGHRYLNRTLPHGKTIETGTECFPSPGKSL